MSEIELPQARQAAESVLQLEVVRSRGVEHVELAEAEAAMPVAARAMARVLRMEWVIWGVLSVRVDDRLLPPAAL